MIQSSKKIETEEHECPDCTYFRSSEVSPYFDDDGVLHIFQGRGTRRGWGTPSVRSNVYWLTADIVAVQVTGWHKYTVSPAGGTYYFVRQKDGSFIRRRANFKGVKEALLFPTKK